MRFWIRELAGWILIFLGLYVFLICVSLLLNEQFPRFLEAGPLTVIGIFLFRGGIHLLKVAVAARICLQAEKKRDVAGAKTSATTKTKVQVGMDE